MQCAVIVRLCTYKMGIGPKGPANIGGFTVSNANGNGSGNGNGKTPGIGGASTAAANMILRSFRASACSLI